MRLLKVSAMAATLLLAALGLLGLLSKGNLGAFEDAGGGAQIPIGNGDVNCDSRLNITDAVHLLQFLFQGGDAPCALAQQGPGFPEVLAELQGIRLALGSLGQVDLSRWPPRPHQMVEIRPGTPSSDPVFTVPEGQWLVITDISFEVDRNGASFALSEEPRFGSRIDRLRLQERTEPDTLKTFQFHSAVGLAFVSESRVFVSANRTSFLLGYLADL